MRLSNCRTGTRTPAYPAVAEKRSILLQCIFLQLAKIRMVNKQFITEVKDRFFRLMKNCFFINSETAYIFTTNFKK